MVKGFLIPLIRSSAEAVVPVANHLVQKNGPELLITAHHDTHKQDRVEKKQLLTIVGLKNK